jgi:WD40 repeat protein
VAFPQPIRRDVPSPYPQINYNRLSSNFDLNAIPRLGPHQLPSICLLTLKTSKQLVNCVTLSHDCRLLAIGCQSSDILVCSIDPDKELYSMKPAKHLRHLLSNVPMNSSSDHIIHTASTMEPSNERVLIGHTAAIFALTFEPNQQTYLLSGSQDCTLRLWHLSTWSCLIVYKLHHLPILDGKVNEEGMVF